ncbi:unnamed protein product [Caenorhabditis angaria]|uniref:SGNH domain-containing protein n=1 Tax=Caenorhabditis angaria TaxID=860376 RepID=A0A9P1IXM9_9PELO|nr:unnamed protein product [Caenorhabditis angaria]
MSKKEHLQGIRAIAIISVLAFHFFPDYFPNGFLGVDHVFARIWQFLAGFLVYIWKQDKNNNESEDEETQGIFSIVENKDTEVEANYENTQIWLLLITILMLFVGFEYPEKIVRIGMTLITALLILISENNNILSNKFMIYIGNISYSLYLIHWPIYCYSKFFNLNKFPFLILSIFLGILIYETFEKWYTTKIERKSQIILSTILFIFCVLAIWREDFRETYMNFTGQFDTIKNNALFGPVNSTNMTLDEIIKINRMYALKDEELLNYKECEYKTKELVPFGLCNVKNLSSTAPFKILIIGNSYAANLAPLIFKSCSKKSNLIWSASHPGCDYLCREYTWHQSCKTTLENPYETIEKMKFDYIFLISQCGGFCVNDEKSDKVDTVLNFAISQIAKIKDFVKHKIYIQTSVTVPSHMNYLDILLANHTSFDEIDKFFSTHLREPRKIGDLRNEKIAKFCGSKCEYFDPYANFQRNPYAPEIFRFFDDNGLAYVHSGGHFTPNAWSKIQPIFDEICDKI